MYVDIVPTIVEALVARHQFLYPAACNAKPCFFSVLVIVVEFVENKRKVAKC
jgi:hypothetical protein